MKSYVTSHEADLLLSEEIISASWEALSNIEKSKELKKATKIIDEIYFNNKKEDSDG
jgi:hypothetical protein